MKKLLLVLVFAGLCAFGYSADFINDDYRETNTVAFHSTGLFTYGLHSNTFHLRNFYFKFDYNFSDLQFFITLNGYKDTHIPETNYAFIVNNINLYDYGVTYLFFDRVFLSLRGAAVYKLNHDSFLLVTPYFSTSNPAEFDSPAQYMPSFIPDVTDPAGIRFGYRDDHFEIGYSQGDFRHAIPIAGVIKYTQDEFYARVTIQRVNSVPLTYVLENFYWTVQLSSAGSLTFGEWKYSLLAEYTWQQPGFNGYNLFRFEQAVEYTPFAVTLAIRELERFDMPFLFEASIKKEFDHVASIGFFAATDGRMYVGTEIKF
jgi:hypothetical protein